MQEMDLRLLNVLVARGAWPVLIGIALGLPASRLAARRKDGSFDRSTWAAAAGFKGRAGSLSQPHRSPVECRRGQSFVAGLFRDLQEVGGGLQHKDHEERHDEVEGRAKGWEPRRNLSRDSARMMNTVPGSVQGVTGRKPKRGYP